MGAGLKILEVPKRTIRIIIESQSNPQFLGKPLEQSYDQRGGLCNGAPGDLVVTASPYDPGYLAYWRELGFSLPTLISVGEDGPPITLSERILRDEKSIKAIQDYAKGKACRVELFSVEDTEIKLAQQLGLPVYSNLEFAKRYTSKTEFRRFAAQIGLPLIDGEICRSIDDVIRFTEKMLKDGNGAIVKSERGTGGMKLAAAARIDSTESIVSALQSISKLGKEFLAERFISGKLSEAALHFEIDFDGNYHFLGIYDQCPLGASGVVGAAYPSGLEPGLKTYVLHTLDSVLIPALQREGYLGYCCMDTMVKPVIHFMDFNPRKGSFRYIHDAVLRLYPEGNASFMQITMKNLPSMTFNEVRHKLGPLSERNDDRGWVMATNPGVFRYGVVDLTGISLNSRREAENLVLKAQELLLH